MSKDKIADYDGTTAGNNTDIGGISIAEGMLPSAVNNSMRELTKQLGAFANGTDAIDALDVTGAATVGGAFTSPGIDDNANATAITIDSSENVGIGVTSMSAKTVINQPSSSDALIIQRAAGVSGNTTFSFPSANSQIAGTNHIILSAGGSERLRIRDSGGITFNGDTAAANALDDYEEGTFTPSFTGGLTGSSYGDQNGTYVKIGQLVFFVIELDITNGQATANGNQIKIDSIPFVSAAASPMIYGQGGAWVIFNNNFYNVDTGIYLQIPTNTNQIKLYRGAGNALAGNDSGVNGQNDLHIAGCYRTA